MPETEEVCGITLTSDFPDRIDSPDPAACIQALVDHGTWVDAAREVNTSEDTLQRWGGKYPEIEEAYKKGRRSLGYEGEQTMVMLMRGQLPDTADEDVEKPKPRTMLNAAKKIVGVNHATKDYTQSQKIIREDGEEAEEVERKLEDMGQDELLDVLNSKMEDE